MRIHWYISSAAVALALSACASGDGGEEAEQFTAFSKTTPGITYEMPAKTLVAEYTVNQFSDAVSVGDSEARDATYQFALNDFGDFTKASLAIEPEVGLSTPPEISFNTLQGDGFVDAGLVFLVGSDYIAAAGGDLNTLDFVKLAVLSDHVAMSFEHQSFGVWLTGFFDSGGGQIEAMTAGAPTLAAGIPNVEATYNGESTGVYVDAEDDPFLAFADFSAKVNFDTLAVTDISATNTLVYDAINDVAGVNTGLDYTGSGTLAVDGTFSATITATNDLAGNMDGLLYGPAA